VRRLPTVSGPDGPGEVDGGGQARLPLGLPAPAGAAPPPPPRDGPAPATPADWPEVEIRTSARRRKTASAYWSDGRVVVLMPAHVRGAKRAELVDWLVDRAIAKQPRLRRSDEALAERAGLLADRYVEGARPSSIRWVTNQSKRWGSCTAQTGEVRLSHRLRAVPDWVLDAVIVHELAHLVHADHSAAFHEVADRYPRQREASVFLDGYILGLGDGGAAPLA